MLSMPGMSGMSGMSVLAFGHVNLILPSMKMLLMLWNAWSRFGSECFEALRSRDPK